MKEGEELREELKQEKYYNEQNVGLQKGMMEEIERMKGEMKEQ